MLYSTDKPVKFLLRSLFLIISSLALLSCGGSSGGGDPSSDSPDPNPSSEVSGVAPITPLTTSRTSTLDLLGLQIALTGEGGSDGDIEVVVNGDSGAAIAIIPLAVETDPGDIESAFPKLQLKNGVPSINIKDVKRTLAVEFTCKNGTSLNGTATADFVSGVVNFSGMVNGQSLSCTSNFQSVLETTVPGMFSISELLDDWGSDDDLNRPFEETGLLSTNCPQDGDGLDDFDNFNFFAENCSGSLLTNYAVTDTSDVVHKATTKITSSTTGSGSLPDIPDIPDIPNVPGIPDIPDIPDIPNVPGIPDLFELCLESGGTQASCQIFK